MENKMLDIDYAKIFYKKLGQGPDIVFIHGWPLHSETFREIVPKLSQHFTCHLFDLPGAGKSEWTKETPISLMDHCETVQRVVDVLGLQNFAVLSHDSGGIFARHLAANNPKRVRALVLGNTDIPGFASTSIALFIRLLGLPGMSSVFAKLLRLKSFRHSRNFGKALLYHSEKLDADFGDLFIEPMMRDRSVLKGQMRLIKAWDWKVVHSLAEVHERISVPVQLIWGKNDGVFPLKPARGMLDQFGGSVELEVIDKARLFVHEDHPDKFAELTLEFLGPEGSGPRNRRLVD